MTATHDPSRPGPIDVAVIIPAFNSGAYLDQALASVAGQTAAPAAVVVADDCSTDDTAERARRWQDRLPIEIIRLDRNQGPGIARHRAIQHTTAALLAMLDADDLFLPDHLETMAALHAAHPGLVSAQELSWYPGAGLTPPAKPRRRAKPAYGLATLLRSNFVSFGFFARGLYDAVGGFRDLDPEDWDLWIRMAQAGAAVTMASHPTAVHRVRPGSRSYDRAHTARCGMDVLSEVLRAAPSAAEAAAARAGLRTLRGKLYFYRAMELAAAGRSREARQAALAGLPAGGARASAGLLAFAVAPAAAARLERLTRQYRLPAGTSTSLD
jgi:glycosyltransferase involved in cell wall biosynthesis